MRTATAVQRVLDHHLHRSPRGRVRLAVIVALAQEIKGGEKPVTPARVLEVLTEKGFAQEPGTSIANVWIDGLSLCGAD